MSKFNTRITVIKQTIAMRKSFILKVLSHKERCVERHDNATNGKNRTLGQKIKKKYVCVSGFISEKN